MKVELRLTRSRRLADRNAGDGVFKALEVDGFGEVVEEAGIEAFADVVLGAVAGEGVALAKFAHEVVAGTVGEADVADDEVNGVGLGGVEGGLGNPKGSEIQRGQDSIRCFRRRDDTRRRAFRSTSGVDCTAAGGMQEIEGLLRRR
jgi:hypothetical protein